MINENMWKYIQKHKENHIENILRSIKKYKHVKIHFI